jgi:hypothetical protein
VKYRFILRTVACSSAVAITVGMSALWANPAAGAVRSIRTPGIQRATINNNFHVVNAPSAVAFRGSPNWNFPTSTGFTNGDSIGLDCYEFGGPAGPYGNTLWYDATDNVNGYSGWINDHYLSTPGTAANPQPQTAECLPSGYGGQFASGPTYQVVGAASSQYFDNSPKSGDYTGSDGYYDNGDSVQLYCFEYGAPTGPYGNPLWYIAYDGARGTFGWINDHYLNTPDTAAHPVPETSIQCGSCQRSSCIGQNPAFCPNPATMHNAYFNIEGSTVLVELRYSTACETGWARLSVTSDNSAIAVSLSAWNPGQPSQYAVRGTNYTYAVNAAPGYQVCGGFQAWYYDEFGKKHYAGWHFAGCYKA